MPHHRCFPSPRPPRWAAAPSPAAGRPGPSGAAPALPHRAATPPLQAQRERPLTAVTAAARARAAPHRTDLRAPPAPGAARAPRSGTRSPASRPRPLAPCAHAHALLPPRARARRPCVAAGARVGRSPRPHTDTPSPRAGDKAVPAGPGSFPPLPRQFPPPVGPSRVGAPARPFPPVRRGLFSPQKQGPDTPEGTAGPRHARGLQGPGPTACTQQQKLEVLPPKKNGALEPEKS